MLDGLKQDIKDIKRLEQVLGVLMKNELGYFVNSLGLTNFLPFHYRIQTTRFSEHNTKPEVIRKTLEELGGGFVKLGQILSLRPDLIPKEYCDEFRKLQDQVEPFPWIEAKAIITSELKKNNKSFAYINPKPIAAASIGQVHEAVLGDNTKVIVKIQRPGIKEIMDSDISLLYHLASLFEKHFGKEIFDAKEVVKEFEEYTKKELDYVLEAKNAERFLANFEKSKEVVIPKVYWQYTTSKILTLEYIYGTKTEEIIKYKKTGYDKKKLAQIVANAVYKQIFIDGYFHADPHPGNVLIINESKIGLLDFGIVGEIDDDLRGKITDFFIGLIEGNLDKITDAMLGFGAIENEDNSENLKRDMKDNFSMYHNTTIDKINMADVFTKIIKVSRDNHVKIPTNFVLLGKSFVTLQGFAVALDPEFNLVGSSKPFVEELVRKRMAPEAIAKRGLLNLKNMKDFFSGLPTKVNQMVSSSRRTNDNMEKLDKDIKGLTNEIDRSSNRLALGFLITGFIIAGALTTGFGSAYYLGFPLFSLICFFVAVLCILLLFISILREKIQ